ncbi:MAG: hypothetical protein DRJ66_06820 [Thermoprotei archaeon]|nr:MAG: hypothetical protein DRJ66_06820 [Thermoprotei archaeon]RLF19431.1 MAG: hypothetical protein DRZ82_05660 [Thermoprotei archaeon]
MHEEEIEELFRKVRVKEFTFKIGSERVIAHADVFLVEIGSKGSVKVSELAEGLKYPIEVVKEVLSFLKDLDLVEYEGEIDKDTEVKLTNNGVELMNRIVKEREESLESLSSALESGLLG